MTARRGAVVVLSLLLAGVGLSGPASAAAPPHGLRAVAAEYPPRAGLAELNDLACVDRSHCLAVGEARIGGKYRTLFERWTGTRWAIMPSPTPQNASLRVTSISCSSPAACMAVGYYQLLPSSNGQHFNALVERWNGTRWRLLPAPTFGIRDSHQYTAVSCPAAQFCVAVGENSATTRSGRRDYAVTATWHGKNWHEVHRDLHGTMEGVSCPSARSCVAIFRPGKGNRLHRLLLANGRWTAHVDNLVGVQSTITFKDLDCFTTSSCTAVGNSYSEGSEDAAAAYHWNGRTWRTLHPGPRMRLHSKDLYGVSCPTANECVAVGLTDRARSQFPGGLQNIPLVERFHDGQTQVVSGRPARNSQTTSLNAVDCLPGGLCRGVGAHSRGDSSVMRPFADQGVLF